MAHSNLGLQVAYSMGMFFSFLEFFVPVFSGWWGDAKLGRFKGIVWGTLISVIAYVIMIPGAAPALLVDGKGVAPFMVSAVLLSIGAGFIRPLVIPLLLDQLEHQRPYTKTLESGEKVLVCPEITIQRILIIYFGGINVGAQLAIATPFAEKYAGYWVAYLIAGTVFATLLPLLILMNKRLIKKPAAGSEMYQFFKIIGAAIKGNKGKLWGKGYWEAARPATLAAAGRTVTWTDKSVADVYRTLEACQVFLYFPLQALNTSNQPLVSNQAAAMTSAGVPNDLMTNFNCLIIIVLPPIFSHGFYPFLERRNIRFGCIDRITFGCILAAISGATGAIVQWRVYETSPCGYQASECPDVSPISIWWQVPTFFLSAVSDMFVHVTGYELAYSRAPPNMKAVVMAMYLLINAVFITLGASYIPLIKDPYLIVSL